MSTDMPRHGETVRWNGALWRVDGLAEGEVRLENACTGERDVLTLAQWLGGIQQELIRRHVKPEPVSGDRPRKGSWMRWKDAVWKITVIRASVINLVNHSTAESGGISLAEWQEGCFEGTIEMLAAPDAELPQSVRELLRVPLDEMPASMRKAVARAEPFFEAWRDPIGFYERYYPDVKVADRVIPTGLSKPKVRAFFALVGAAHGVRPIGFSNFCAWYKKVEAADGDLRAMAPRHDKQGPHERYMHPRVEDWLATKINEVWLTPSCARKKTVFKALKEQVIEWNQAHPDRRLAWPSQSHVAKYIREEVDRYVAISRRKGKKEADRLIKQVGMGPETSYVGERVEVDNTLVKINLRHDQTGVKLGYPWITAGLDHYSRMPLALHVNYENQSLGSALQCLKMTMSPKGFVRALVPDIDYDPPSLVPEMFFFDHGPDFSNKHILMAGACLNVRMEFEPVACPEFKAGIERFWRTLKEDIKEGLFKNPKRGEPELAGIDENGEPWMTYSEFVRRLWAWATMDYAKRFHRGINDVPVRRLLHSLSRKTPRALRKKDDLLVLLTHLVECTPSNLGVTWSGLKWTGKAIERILSDPQWRDGMTVRVRFDEYDVSQAWVINPFNARNEKLDPFDGKYMAALSLHAHDVIVKSMGKAEDGSHGYQSLRKRRENMEADAQRRLGLLGGKAPRAASPAIAKFAGIGQRAPSGDDLADVLPHGAPPPNSRAEPPPLAGEEAAEFDDKDFEATEPVRTKRQARRVRNH